MRTKIKDLAKGQETVIVGDIFKNMKNKKNADGSVGEPWIHLKVSDNGGSCYAKIWNNLELYPTINGFADGTTVEAEVTCVEAGQYIHIEVKSIKEVEKKEGVFVDAEGLKNELRAAIAGLKDEHLKKLVCRIFARPDMQEAYFKSPATMMSGYSFEGGVVAYVVRSIRLCKVIAEVFNNWNHNVDNFATNLNEDLLTAACIIDSVGKIRAFKMNGTRVEKTTEGELFEDSYLTMKVVLEEIGNIEFPEEQRLVLEHVLGSAKGRSDWGALHSPRSREAVALNLILNLNLQMGHFEFLDRNADATDLFAKLFQKVMFLGNYDA